MPRTDDAPAMSFDDHVAQALALVADRHPTHPSRTVNRPPHPSRSRLARVIPLPARAAGTDESRR